MVRRRLHSGVEFQGLTAALELPTPGSARVDAKTHKREEKRQTGAFHDDSRLVFVFLVSLTRDARSKYC